MTETLRNREAHEAAELRLRLGFGVIIGVLVIDRRHVELRPVGWRHCQPVAVGLEPPFEHPFGLVLLRRYETDSVLAQPLGREVLLDVGGEAPLIVGCLLRRVMGGFIA